MDDLPYGFGAFHSTVEVDSVMNNSDNLDYWTDNDLKKQMERDKKELINATRIIQKFNANS